MNFRRRVAACSVPLCAVLLLVSAATGGAQPKTPAPLPAPLPPAEGERAARQLLDQLLTQKPAQNAVTVGALKIRGPGRQERETPVRFLVQVTPTNWLGAYQSAPVGTMPGETFTVLHDAGGSEEYFVGPTGAGLNLNAARKLTGNQLMAPFAGSDFWLVDLSLEFLRWPQQRVLKKEMRKNLFCDVLESTNPQLAHGAYSRVVCWIAANRPEEIIVVHAEAYDFDGRLLKEFDPKKVEKVNGVWQLEEMEIRNRQTGSRTRIQFNLDSQ